MSAIADHATWARVCQSSRPGHLMVDEASAAMSSISAVLNPCTMGSWRAWQAWRTSAGPEAGMAKDSFGACSGIDAVNPRGKTERARGERRETA